MEAVAAEIRALPQGGTIREDYEFDHIDANGAPARCDCPNCSGQAPIAAPSARRSAPAACRCGAVGTCNGPGNRGRGFPRLLCAQARESVRLIKTSTITCPKCGHQATEHMPTDTCQFFTIAKVAANASNRSRETAVSSALKGQRLVRRNRLRWMQAANISRYHHDRRPALVSV
jgi:hypothetical protein